MNVIFLGAVDNDFFLGSKGFIKYNSNFQNKNIINYQILFIDNFSYNHIYY